MFYSKRYIGFWGFSLLNSVEIDVAFNWLNLIRHENNWYKSKIEFENEIDLCWGVFLL